MLPLEFGIDRSAAEYYLCQRFLLNEIICDWQNYDGQERLYD